jgi:hypothetical protein
MRRMVIFGEGCDLNADRLLMQIPQDASASKAVTRRPCWGLERALHDSNEGEIVELAVRHSGPECGWSSEVQVIEC